MASPVADKKASSSPYLLISLVARRLAPSPLPQRGEHGRTGRDLGQQSVVQTIVLCAASLRDIGQLMVLRRRTNG